jgi:ubiquinone/menaquinone biosynthesis C-methylase UbiE
MSKNLIYTQYAHLYSLWRKALFDGDEQPILQQTELLQTLLGATTCQTVIDLGGGIGTHAIPLFEQGYQVTVLDISPKALQLLKEQVPALPTIQGDFSQIQVNHSFDAAICFWSTINYLLTPEAQKHFFRWLTTHVRKCVIIDQANFLRYPKTYSAQYQAEDASGRINVQRHWEIEKQFRKTHYTYHFTDLQGNIQVIEDSEEQYFFTLQEMQELMGKAWQLKHVLGEYSLDAPFVESQSKRLITIFEPKPIQP